MIIKRYNRYAILVFILILGLGGYWFGWKNIEYKEINNDWAKNIVWYQIIPDKRANGNTKNDASSRPVIRNNFSGIYNGVSLQEARRRNGVKGNPKPPKGGGFQDTVIAQSQFRGLHPFIVTQHSF